ncbi:MAG: hypothetical protein WC196_02885 [Bacilli bacterium]
MVRKAKNYWLFLFLTALLFITGCAGATGVQGLNSTDATERGLSYVAAAIVTSAVIRAFCNK